MIASFLIILRELSTVFFLILLGFLGGKTGLISRDASDSMAGILFWYVTPATAVVSLQRSFNPEMLKGFLSCCLIAVVYYTTAILVVRFTVREKAAERRSVLRICSVFSNLGMLALPLQMQLFGSDGAFYGMAFITDSNLIFWSYGALVMNGGKGGLPWRRMFLNPGLLGSLTGFLLFIRSVELPALLNRSLSSVSQLMLPLGMLVIGQRLAEISFRSLLDDRAAWLAAFRRLLLFPALVLLALSLTKLRGTAPICAAIGYCAPAASSVSILAIQYRQDVDLAVKSVSLQMVLSLVTMPILIALAYTLLA